MPHKISHPTLLGNWEDVGWGRKNAKPGEICRPFHSQNLTSNSPYYLPYNSYDVSSENLVLDQLIIP